MWDQENGVGKQLFARIDFCYKYRDHAAKCIRGSYMSRGVDYIIQSIFEPALSWVLDHPIITVLAVGALIFFSVRNYRML